MNVTAPSQVRNAVRKSLKSLGFYVVDRYYVATDLNPDASVYINLSVDRDDEFGFAANSTFALRIHSLHRLYSSLVGSVDTREFVAASFRPPWHSGFPSPERWPVPSSMMTEQIGAFTEFVRTHILVPLKDVATAEALSRALLDRVPSNPFSWPRRWWDPVAHLALGEPTEALRVAQLELAAALVSSPLGSSYASAYEAFVGRIHARIGEA